jgi:hypothetical protein
VNCALRRTEAAGDQGVTGLGARVGWHDVRHHRVVSGDIAAYPVTPADVPMFVRLGTPDTARLEDALRRW